VNHEGVTRTWTIEKYLVACLSEMLRLLFVELSDGVDSECEVQRNGRKFGLLV